MMIRPMLPEDVPGIAHWVAETELWKRYGVTEPGFGARLSAGLAQKAGLFVAEEQTEVVGFIWIVDRGAFNRSGYIQLIGVRPSERGQGVGRALMQFAEVKVFAETPDLFLLVSDFNTEAQRFYRGLGYKEIGGVDDYVVPGIRELIYWKRR